MKKEFTQKLICLCAVFLSWGTVGRAQNWNKNAFIGSDGAAEMGKVIDFHETNGGAEDYSLRLAISGGKLSSTGGFALPGIGINTNSFGYGQVHVFGNSPTATNLILSANYESIFRWRFKTTDRGNAIDLDITGSNGTDQEESLIKLSPSFSGRPEFSFLNDWLVINNGNIGVGTATPTEKLSVNGKIRAKEIKVETGWADFVFAKAYKLPTLQAIESHIKEKGHLPGIPSAAEVEKNGVELGDMNKRLLQKIEELTLYLIEQKKEIDALKASAQRNDGQNEKFQLELKDLKSKLK
jgi:hypothetical protein